VTANWLEIHGLSRHPWLTETAVDEGTQFAAEVSIFLKNKCGTNCKIVTSRNPQSNSVIEQCHKPLHNVIGSVQIKDKTDLDSSFGFQDVLAAPRKAMNSTVHTTSVQVQCCHGQCSVVGQCQTPHSRQTGNLLRNTSRDLSFKTTSVRTLNGLKMRTMQETWQQPKLALSASMALTHDWTQ